MSFLTCRCDLPQKLQRSCSFASVGRAIASLPQASPKLMLGDHPVLRPVLHCLFGGHEVVALGVRAYLVVVLPGVLGDDVVQALADVDDLPPPSFDVRALSL